MAVDNHIIGTVENAVVNLLEERLSSVFAIMDVDIEKNLDEIHRFPALMISTDSLKFDSVTQVADNVKPDLHIYALFKSNKSVNKERYRRHGVYPIVLGITKILKGKDFNLEIDGLQPLNAREVITKETREKNVVMFDIQFKWNFEIEEDKTDEEMAADLLEIANTFIIDNQTEIVTDIHNLSEE